MEARDHCRQIFGTVGILCSAELLVAVTEHQDKEGTFLTDGQSVVQEYVVPVELTTWMVVDSLSRELNQGVLYVRVLDGNSLVPYVLPAFREVLHFHLVSHGIGLISGLGLSVEESSVVLISVPVMLRMTLRWTLPVEEPLIILIPVPVTRRRILRWTSGNVPASNEWHFVLVADLTGGTLSL